MLLNHVLDIKLQKHFEAKAAENFISSTFSFFDMINLLSVVKGKNIIADDFNQNWKILHGEIFEEVFNTITKTMKPEISKREFNVIFKIAYEDDERTKICKENINTAIKLSFPLLISHLNVEPKLKLLTDDIKGDIGVSTNDLE